MSRDPADQIEEILHDGKDMLSRIATVLGMDRVEAQRDELLARVRQHEDRLWRIGKALNPLAESLFWDDITDSAVKRIAVVQEKRNA